MCTLRLREEHKKMKSKLLALVLLAAGSMFAGTRVIVGVGGFGLARSRPPRPPAPVVASVGPRYGYYARPYWVPPRYYGHRYFRGYWHR